MSSFSIRLGTTRNQQRDRDWNKKHITEIHSSFVFEELLSSHVSRQIERGALQFNSHAVVGIELLEASETKTYTQHTFDDTHHQVLVHEFMSETFDYDSYMMTLDEQEKFCHFATVVRDVLVPLLDVQMFSTKQTISDIIEHCLKQIEMNDYKLVVLLNKTPKSNKKRNRVVLFKLIVSVTGATFWIEGYEKGIRLFHMQVIEEIASFNAFSLYFGTSRWESDDVFVIQSDVRNWNARVDFRSRDIDVYKRER
ncbi:hypothetical protein EVJ33_05030 [Exiguobacterium sp. SL-10]|uniref:hypothetical protein n=1 Tax=Exiguobacterium sp. SL-10 TaxID=2510962 RepID=UPI00103AF3FA|nr:hypothetical protein [Exiguobacterium sp. SL-10]TCI30663.1 hypothetical protein EVJ33_05030 [Exiguobacterium sp. SL-10]